MFDDLDPRSPTPLYAQIASRVRMAVAAGELGGGDALPSVRQLARTARVNPATVVQAYQVLERDGFVETRHGAGTFVLDLSAETRDRERRAQAAELARNVLAEAARMGLTRDEVVDALRALTPSGTLPSPATAEVE